MVCLCYMIWLVIYATIQHNIFSNVVLSLITHKKHSVSSLRFTIQLPAPDKKFPLAKFPIFAPLNEGNPHYTVTLFGETGLFFDKVEFEFSKLFQERDVQNFPMNREVLAVSYPVIFWTYQYIYLLCTLVKLKSESPPR